MSIRSRIVKRTYLVMVTGLTVALLGSLVGPGAAGASPASALDQRLTNLDHLDFLYDTVTPPEQDGHTTYRIAEEPDLGALWTYADRREGGVYERIGGGPYDPDTGTWGQGAFNADDFTRAAVVYLRHWQQVGDETSRDRAYQLLRGVTYLQTAGGPNAGNVVLWMQPDGTLNPSAEPVELPDPSDSGPSYWLARTIWALGEGYSAFVGSDPEFAAFLGERLDLALAALERQVLVRYGKWDVADGERVPAWLIVDGADASSEAILGLESYVSSPQADTGMRERASTAMEQLAEGVAAMSAGDVRDWPYGAILPWTHSRSIWHAWASQMPAALARSATALDRGDLLRPAVQDAAVFTPYLLASTGAINGWLPSPSDRTQIAYGVDSRLQSLLAVGAATGESSFERLATVTASWYFGANPADQPMYDPETGRTYDGINGDGVVNRNSGAESTIHGLLSMLALDSRPDLAAAAASTTSVVAQDGVTVVEAESADSTGNASVVTPDPAWTGESLWSGSYLELSRPASANWQLPSADQPRLVAPVVDLVEDRQATALTWFSGDDRLGDVRTGAGGPQGVTEAAGALLPVTLRGELPSGAIELRSTARPGGNAPAKVDTILLRPRVARLVLEGDDSGAALLHSAARRTTTVEVELPGSGPATIRSYDSRGHQRGQTMMTGDIVAAPVLAGGFTLVSR